MISLTRPMLQGNLIWITLDEARALFEGPGLLNHLTHLMDEVWNFQHTRLP